MAVQAQRGNALENGQMTDEDNLFQKLTDCCERAYADGLDSADIYKSLHSISLILKEREKESTNTKTGNKNEIPKTDNSLSFKTERSKKFKCIHVFFQVMRDLRKAWTLLISFLFLALLLHSAVCTLFLNVSPFKTLAIFMPTFFPLQDKQCLLPSHPLIMEMVRPILNCSVCRGDEFSGSPVIYFESRPSKEEFLKVAYSSKPIIVKGGALGLGPAAAAGSFNLSVLKEIFESEPGAVDSVSEECQFLPLRSTFQTFREALEAISNFTNEDKDVEGEPWYIGWSNCHPGVASKLRELFPRPDFLPENSESSAIDWIFIGSPGLGAAMHIDYVRRPSWQAQLSGRKRWTLRPPPDCEDVCPDQVTFTINPGDLLFLETNSWYHETFIEKNELSISIGSEYD